MGGGGVVKEAVQDPEVKGNSECIGGIGCGGCGEGWGVPNCEEERAQTMRLHWLDGLGASQSQLGSLAAAAAHHSSTQHTTSRSLPPTTVQTTCRSGALLLTAPSL